MHRHSSPPLPTRPEIDVFDLYDNFELVGKTSVAGIKHTRFTLLPDGWAASVALANGWKLEGDDAHFRDCLFRKTIHSQELGIESLALHGRFDCDAGKENGLVECEVESYWREVCHEMGYHSVPREVMINHRSKDRQGGEEYYIPVRIRQPLELPFLSREAQDFVYPLHQNKKTHLIPQSAIFFASRFHRLRELVRKLEIAKSGLGDPRRGHRERTEYEQRKQELLKEIYSVLLSASLYLAAMLRSNAEDSRDSGRDKMGYYAETWLEVYEKGTARGSEIFGMRDGFGANGDFLLKHRKELSAWSEGAIDWWCSDTSDGATDRVDRLVLKDALELLKKELFEMFAGMFNEIKRRMEKPAGIGPLPNDNPFILSSPSSSYLLPLLPMFPSLDLESYTSFCGYSPCVSPKLFPSLDAILPVVQSDSVRR